MKKIDYSKAFDHYRIAEAKQKIHGGDKIMFLMFYGYSEAVAKTIIEKYNECYGGMIWRLETST